MAHQVCNCCTFRHSHVAGLGDLRTRIWCFPEELVFKRARALDTSEPKSSLNQSELFALIINSLSIYTSNPLSTHPHLHYPFHSLRGPLYLYSFNQQFSSAMLSSRFMRNVSRLPSESPSIRDMANPSSTGRASRHLHPPFFRIQSPHQLIIQEIIRREDR